MKRFFAWITRNERHLSALVFVGSFVFDAVSYTRIDLPWINTLLSTYVVGAASMLIIYHALNRVRPDGKLAGAAGALRSLVLFTAQFAIGGLLSGCLILYTRNADFFVSWPFIVLFIIVFVGSEFLHQYKNRLAFQLSLFFFGVYAYAIFAIPLARGEMGLLVFLQSGLVSLVVFAALVTVLFAVNPKHITDTIRRIAVGAGGVFLIVTTCYITGVLPPLPLSLRDAGIYHSITKTTSGYEVQSESQNGSLNPFTVSVLHHTAHTPLYAYSAIFAPVQLATPIVHRWQQYDTATSSWQTIAAVAFSISGGRDAGYRGYSMLSNPSAGEWRVSIETTSGSVLGRERFDVVEVTEPPQTETIVK